MSNIRKLIDKLNYNTILYDSGKPILSDKEWDDCYFELQKEEERTGIIYPDSPTQKIYFQTVSKLEKVNHDHPMLSLDKSKDIKDIADFLHNHPFVAMFKMDGLTCSLTYENGELIRAETRGNGETGENILHNALVVKNIPKHIPTKERTVVDGEIICRKDDFKEFADEYKNPRNFAAGSIRLLSAKECSQRKLTFVAWELIEGFSQIKVFWKRLEKLEELGFTIVPMVHGKETPEAAIEEFNNNFEEAAAIYPTDGYVFKFEDVDYGNEKGQTDHHLKNAIAYKLYEEWYDTKLQTITWTMGRTGILTPVAIFDPIEIDGSIVSRASLHNVTVMKDTLGECAYYGEPLKVYKANMIIPQIAEAGPKYNYGQVIAQGGVSANDVIEICPICGHPIDYITSDAGIINAYCSNPSCEGKFLNRLLHFCGSKGLNILGLSEKTLNKLIDWGWIDSFKDIFTLEENHKHEWIRKPGFGAASVTKVLKSIKEAKKPKLNKFIASIGIPLIGNSASTKLAKTFKTYEAFRNAVDDSSYDFSSIGDFGIEMNDSLKNFNYSEADEVAKLLDIQPIEETKGEDNLKGKKFVITGKLAVFKNRKQLKEIIESHDGSVVESISAKTTALINNDIDSTSSKNKAAKARNIPIISELDFIEQYLED